MSKNSVVSSLTPALTFPSNSPDYNQMQAIPVGGDSVYMDTVRFSFPGTAATGCLRLEALRKNGMSLFDLSECENAD